MPVVFVSQKNVMLHVICCCRCVWGRPMDFSWGLAGGSMPSTSEQEGRMLLGIPRGLKIGGYGHGSGPRSSASFFLARSGLFNERCVRCGETTAGLCSDFSAVVSCVTLTPTYVEPTRTRGLIITPTAFSGFWGWMKKVGRYSVCSQKKESGSWKFFAPRALESL